MKCVILSHSFGVRLKKCPHFEPCDFKRGLEFFVDGRGGLTIKDVIIYREFWLRMLNDSNSRRTDHVVLDLVNNQLCSVEENPDSILNDLSYLIHYILEKYSEIKVHIMLTTPRLPKGLKKTKKTAVQYNTEADEVNIRLKGLEDTFPGNVKIICRQKIHCK